MFLQNWSKGANPMSNVFAEFIQNYGLYDQIEITESNIEDLILFIEGKEK